MSPFRVGTELAMKCPSCDFDNIAGMDVCSECGADLRDLDVPGPATDLLETFGAERLKDLLPGTPLLLSPDTAVRDVVARMAESGCNCALVVQDDILMGILNERDILTRVALEFDRLADHPVSEFMTINPESLSLEDNIAFGLNRMMAGDFRHVPVHQDGKPLGVVSIKDVLAFAVRRHPDWFQAH
jgi:signal-transduction protein with cAMP-binding, CBS, and nucleotidyltransferase domain